MDSPMEPCICQFWSWQNDVFWPCAPPLGQTMIVDNLFSFAIVRYFIWPCYRHTFVVNTEYIHSINSSNPKKVGTFSKKMEYRWLNCSELQRNIDLQGANFKILKSHIAGSIGNYLLLSLNYFYVHWISGSVQRGCTSGVVTLAF